MKPFVGWMLVCVLSGTMPAHAQVYKWVGPDGKVQYGDTPPPATDAKSRSEAVAAPAPSRPSASLPFDLAEAVRKNPVTFYSATNCAPCDMARSLLMSRGVPFTEKTVRTSDDVAYLREISGDSQVPVMIVGTRKHQGFVAQEWDDSLTTAGYPATNRLPKTYRNPPPEAAAPRKEEPVAEKPAPAAPPMATELPPPAGNAPPGFRF